MMTRYYAHHADYCVKLPDNVTLEEGALLEPLSVAVHACRRGGVSMDSRVLICGAGPIGLVTLLTAKAAGARKVIVTDVVSGRLEFAQRLGADATVLVTAGEQPEKAASTIKAAMGDRPNVSIECSGAESSLQTAIIATQSGGVVLVVGIGPTETKIPVSCVLREVDVRGVFRYAHCYDEALALVSTGRVDLKPLVTHRFGLEDVVEAFEMAKSPDSGAVKVIVECGDKN